MRRIGSRFSFVLAVLLLPLAVQAPLAQTAAGEPARVIVQYRSDSGAMKQQAGTASGKRALQAKLLGDRVGVTLTPGGSISDRSHLVSALGLSSMALAARLAADADVEFAVPDQHVRIASIPNDALFTAGDASGPAVGQWYLKTPGAAAGASGGTGLSSIDAERAWDINKGSTSIVVADIDTGVRLDHPDLAGKLVAGYDMVSNDLTAADGQPGRDDDPSDPGDFVSSADVTAGTPDCASTDVGQPSSWHGTKTTGLIGAATDNGIGVAGSGRDVKVQPVRVLGKCGGSETDVLAGMRWAAGIHVPDVPDNLTPARVMNLSLGNGGSCDAAYQQAVNDVLARGVAIVASAGNDSVAVGAPANCVGVISVAGLRSEGDKNGFSNLGAGVTIAAPGGNCGTGSGCLYPIISTSNAGTTTPGANSYSNAVDRPSFGTSFSAPLVSGTAALLLSAKPSLTPDAVRALLTSTARPFPTSGSTAGTAICSPTTTTAQVYCYCTTSTCGAGMLDAYAALVAATGVQAVITVANTSVPMAGQPLVFTSAASVVGADQSIVSYQWALVSAGTSGATVSGSTTGSTFTVLPTANGTVVVSLTTTDNRGYVSTATAGAGVGVDTGGVVHSGGGGGGALGLPWLVLLAGAVLALAGGSRDERRRSGREAGALSASGRRSGRRR